MALAAVLVCTGGEASIQRPGGASMNCRGPLYGGTCQATGSLQRIEKLDSYIKIGLSQQLPPVSCDRTYNRREGSVG